MMNLCSNDKVDIESEYRYFTYFMIIHNLTFICNNKISNPFLVKLFTLEQICLLVADFVFNNYATKSFKSFNFLYVIS